MGISRERLTNIAATAALFCLPIAIYWLAGGNFERGAPLAATVSVGATFAVCGWGVWGK